MSSFQCGNRLLSRDCRKGVEELVEAVVPFEVVNQVTERYARPDEYRCAAQNVRIAMNNRRSLWHARLYLDRF
jgi:hypothetical protein